MNENPATYFKKYRETIGFTNQNDAKNFLAGKDISSSIDFVYINGLNKRIVEIIKKMNTIADKSNKRDNLEDFINKNILLPYKIIKGSNLIPQLNNQGRRPEEVLFSWLRGYSVVEYFTPSFSKILKIPISSITRIGDDDLKNVETFRRSPKADLEFTKDHQKIRLEVQSGFQGTNDIKEHKVREARKIYLENKIKTICIHIDLFNGQVAFVQLNEIKENDINFVTRQQMEGQSVFSIDQNYFKWRLLDKLPKLIELELSI